MSPAVPPAPEPSPDAPTAVHNLSSPSPVDHPRTVTQDSAYPVPWVPAPDFPILELGSRYRLLGEIARGGMGVVYRALDLLFRREVAVKVLQDRYPVDSPAAQRFVEEARITGQLPHPSIPAVHDLGTLPDGRPYMVMKLIQGRTLAELLAERKDLSSDRTRLVAVFEQLCQAVAFAHNIQVIHRDLKPANVMVGQFGEVQVMDWGLAKSLACRGSTHRRPEVSEDGGVRPHDAPYETQAGAVLGTPAYMAPEQARGEPVDERADVFALGAILCHILTGLSPFEGKNPYEILGLAAAGDLSSALDRLDRGDVEPELMLLCMRCLAPDPAERFEDAGEVAAAMARFRAGLEERAREAGLEQAAKEGRRRERRRQVVWWFAAELLVITCSLVMLGGMFIVSEWCHRLGVRGLWLCTFLLLPLVAASILLSRAMDRASPRR